MKMAMTMEKEWGGFGGGGSNQGERRRGVG